MRKCFLVYWQYKNVVHEIKKGLPLDYASSSQFNRLGKDDVIWFITVKEGKPFLVCKLIVGEQTNWFEAVKILGRENIRKGRFVVIAQTGTAEIITEISIEDIVSDLRFVSSVNDRLTVTHGKINPQQLQVVRQLTEDSHSKLCIKWQLNR